MVRVVTWGGLGFGALNRALLEGTAKAFFTATCESEKTQSRFANALLNTQSSVGSYSCQTHRYMYMYILSTFPGACLSSALFPNVLSAALGLTSALWNALPGGSRVTFSSRVWGRRDQVE